METQTLEPEKHLRPADFHESDESFMPPQFETFSYDVWYAPEGELSRAVITEKIPDGYKPDPVDKRPGTDPSILFAHAGWLMKQLNSSMGDANRSLGFEVQEQEQYGGDTLLSREVTFADAAAANAAIDSWNLPEEHSVIKFVMFEGEEYSSLEFAQFIADETFPLADRGWHRVHDSIFHIPAWILIPPSIRKFLTAEAQVLIDNYKSIENFDVRNGDHRQAKNELGNFMRKVDNVVNTLRLANGVINPDTQADDPYWKLSFNVRELLQTSLWDESQSGIKVPEIDDAVSDVLAHAAYLREHVS